MSLSYSNPPPLSPPSRQLMGRDLVRGRLPATVAPEGEEEGSGEGEGSGDVQCEAKLQALMRVRGEGCGCG